MSGQEHQFCGFLVKVKQMLWRLQVAAPVHLRTKNIENFSLQLLHGFYSVFQEKNPKIVVCPDCYFQKRKAKGCHMATVPFVLVRGRVSNPWRYAFPKFGSRIRKDLVAELKKVQYKTLRKIHCNWKNPGGFSIILAIHDNHLSSYRPRVSMWFKRNDKSDQFLERQK